MVLLRWYQCVLRDLARFSVVMLQEGSINGKQVIPISWVKDVRHGQHGLPLNTSRIEL